MNKSLMLIILSILALTLIGCGDSVECTVKEGTFYFCDGANDLSYRCPAGTAAEVQHNDAIDAECDEEDDADARANCHLDAARDGRYEMVEAELAEDCGAADKTCSWETGRCED